MNKYIFLQLHYLTQIKFKTNSLNFIILKEF